MNYFVTGATGFIGRHLVEELLKREGTIYALVREGSRGKIETSRKRSVPATESFRSRATSRSRGSASRASTRRSTTSSTSPRSTTWPPTRSRCRRRTSRARATSSSSRTRTTSAASTTCPRSPSPAPTRARGGRRCSTRTRSSRTPTTGRSTSRRRSRATRSRRSCIVYRPAIVLGHSETGEMDKIDGPYYFFKLLQRLRKALPQWFPLAGPEGEQMNMVPVDFVAKAMDHIAHMDGRRPAGRHVPPDATRSRRRSARRSTRSRRPGTRRTSRCASTAT